MVWNNCVNDDDKETWGDEATPNESTVWWYKIEVAMEIALVTLMDSRRRLFRSRVAITLHIHAGLDSQIDTPGLHRTNESHHLRAPPSDAGTAFQHPLGCRDSLGFSHVVVYIGNLY